MRHCKLRSASPTLICSSIIQVSALNFAFKSSHYFSGRKMRFLRETFFHFADTRPSIIIAASATAYIYNFLVLFCCLICLMACQDGKESASPNGRTTRQPQHPIETRKKSILRDPKIPRNGCVHVFTTKFLGGRKVLRLLLVALAMTWIMMSDSFNDVTRDSSSFDLFDTSR